jgi:DNA-binding GntR family transcriptional regulator
MRRGNGRSAAKGAGLDRWAGDARATGEPAARRVYSELKSAIVTMKLTPGQALSENEIAARLGVSRQPVREAFIKLSEAGLVRIRPQRGTFVVKISVKQVTDARFVREAVEVAVARKASEVMSADAIADLKRNLDAQRAAAVEAVPARFLALDEAFHRGLALGVDCDYAWRVVEEVKAQMDRVRYLSLPQATPISRLVDQHAAILAAVETGDADAAEATIRTHLAEILTSLPVLERQFPHLFEDHEDIETTTAAQTVETVGA